tara:strand:- start:400 stop:699 length:300 start_codon:yes stop_codon:yes gene_type:complete
MKIIGVERDTIDAFKSQWPCHGISEDVDFICVAFDDNGDLVDYDCEDVEGNVVTPGNDSGEALRYLMSDAWNHHTERFIPSTIGPILTANPSYPLTSAD